MQIRDKPVTSRALTVSAPAEFVWRRRGKPELRGQSIVFHPRNSEEYVPDLRRAAPLAQDLAKVRTPADALRFVEVHGPLRWGWTDEAGEFEELSGFAQYEDDTDEIVVPFDDFHDHGFKLHKILKAAARIRKYDEQDALKIRAEALKKLRAEFGAPRYRALSDADFVTAISEWVCASLNDFTWFTRPGLRAGRLGTGAMFNFTLVPSSLLGACYLGAVQAAAGAQISECPGCDGVFNPEHKKQMYCTPQCSARTRQRQFRKGR